jgi:serine phosphatase RsbU (regulator of sigma subunit)/HAMP domain-containing protein
MLAVFLVAAALAWIFARHALAPVEALTRAAHRVHHGELDQEVAVTTDDEIGELATTFNEMVASVSRRITLLHRIQEWTVKIGKELESERLYGTLVAMFSLMSGARTCRLYIYNDADGKLESRMERGGSHLPPPDDDTLAKQAFEERWVQYMTDKGAVTDDFTKGRQIAIPLLTGDRRIGVIRIGAKPDRTAYDEETLTILQTLAQHASVAADNAHLYEELAEKERIEQEMRWARRIQQSMLPRETPSLPGYEVAGKSLPAREVGGDYFDFMTTDGLSWYMVVADVSGKGVPAALIMSIVRSLLHTFTELETTPGEVLTRVNRKLSNDLEPDMFVTTAAVLLDPMQHTVSIARGGHEPIIIRRADGSTERVEPQGAALGLLDVDLFEHALENYETPIAEHEVIVLYTDGVTEARNAAGEEFGIDRLETIVREKGDLPAAELLEQIKAEVLAFASGVMQHDDITLVVLRRQG